jgi:lysine N6-hydroxylase
MEWASARNENVVFGERVLSVDFDRDFVVYTNKRMVTAHNLSIGVGRQQWVPDVATLGERQFHAGDILVKGQDLGGKRVCVVGGGQSGAEVFLDLITRPVAVRPRRG